MTKNKLYTNASYNNIGTSRHTHNFYHNVLNLLPDNFRFLQKICHAKILNIIHMSKHTPFELSRDIYQKGTKYPYFYKCVYFILHAKQMTQILQKMCALSLTKKKKTKTQIYSCQRYSHLSITMRVSDT